MGVHKHTRTYADTYIHKCVHTYAHKHTHKPTGSASIGDMTRNQPAAQTQTAVVKQQEVKPEKSEKSAGEKPSGLYFKATAPPPEELEVLLYTCMHAYIHTYIYTCMYSSIFKATAPCPEELEVLLYTCMHACIHTYINMYVYV
jgi:hypothetical protein